ncbi:uncharacterized protein N7506_009083 [Penicillium brevicompactum]|uniref:uncharacterized protein n=1 Tax=Penicillium brevicompactum TaxID=5074 RepID=UPI00253FEC70|nr:uncharacterized protein N7506_009083 [Penicillium brevicompactum]KAJ5325981.1 hypothetical protein N7506_009083 [Penicillium brevicompactum]
MKLVVFQELAPPRPVVELRSDGYHIERYEVVLRKTEETSHEPRKTLEQTDYDDKSTTWEIVDEG